MLPMKTLSEAPVTQSIGAVVSLLKYIGKPFDPLPEIVPLSECSQLTRSSKGDCYYMTSLKGCTCIGFVYHQNCRHMKILRKEAEAAPEEKAGKIAIAKAACAESRHQAQEYQARQRELKAKTSHLEPDDSIRPSGKWPGGHNGPVGHESIKAKTTSNETGA
jgi:hypothetical protein